MKALLALAAAAFWSALCLAAPTTDDIRAIRIRLQQEALPQASVDLAADGRVKLTGQYRNRAEVQLAFSIAQQTVGVRWVAPTTPENVRYPGTEGTRAAILAALRKPKPTTTEAAPPARHALVVGVGTYRESNIPPIPNAGDDAKAFFNLLGRRGFKRENSVLLLEGSATRDNVRQAMADIARRVGPSDTVVLYFSTHGGPPNDLANLAIVLHDTQIDGVRKTVVSSSAVQDDDIRRFIEELSPARVMVVLDVCYSGAAFRNVPGFLASTSKDLFVEESNYATGVSRASMSYLAGTRAEQEKIFVAASSENEKSWNSSELKQGYFTYYFVRELDGQGDVQKAFMAAKPIVQAEVKRIVSAEQRKDITQTPQASFIPSSANFRFQQ